MPSFKLGIFVVSYLNMNQPTLHKPVPIGTRVRIPENYYKEKNKLRFGTVAGIASMHVIFTYIIILDELLDSEFGELKAVVVNGPELISEDGLTDWKL